MCEAAFLFRLSPHHGDAGDTGFVCHLQARVPWTFVHVSLAGRHVCFPEYPFAHPAFQVMVQIGLINSLWSLIVANVTFTAPSSVWLMRAFLENVPLELEVAAALGGTGFFEILFRVVVPTLRPGIATVAIYTITVWTEYSFASRFIIDEARHPLAVGLAGIVGQYQIDWGLLAAGGVFMALPLVIMFAFIGRYFVEGSTAGAIK